MKILTTDKGIPTRDAIACLQLQADKDAVENLKPTIVQIIRAVQDNQLSPILAADRIIRIIKEV